MGMKNPRAVSAAGGMETNLQGRWLMSELTIFAHHEFGNVQTVQINGDPWFVANGVAQALGYRDASNACRRLDDDEKGLLDQDDIVAGPTALVAQTGQMSGLRRQHLVVSESGMFALILWSERPEAKKFRKWVTQEVLPSIRKTGSYSLPERPPLLELPAGTPAELMEFDKALDLIVHGPRHPQTGNAVLKSSSKDYYDRMYAWHGLRHVSRPVVCPMLVLQKGKCQAYGRQGRVCLCTLDADVRNHKSMWQDGSGNLVYTSEPYDLMPEKLDAFRTGLTDAGLKLSVSPRSPWYPTFTTLLKVTRAL